MTPISTPVSTARGATSRQAEDVRHAKSKATNAKPAIAQPDGAGAESGRRSGGQDGLLLLKRQDHREQNRRTDDAPGPRRRLMPNWGRPWSPGSDRHSHRA